MLSSLRDLESRLRSQPSNGRLAPVVQAALLSALDEGPHAIALFDEDDLLVYGNKVFREAWSVAPAGQVTFDALIRDCHTARRGAIIDTTDIDQWLAEAKRLRRHGPAFRAFEVDFWDGRWFWISERRLQSGWLLAVAQDITALKQSERALKAAHASALHVSLTDALTHLPNRRSATLLLERLFHQELPFYLALVDLDHFKQINDSYGHGVGDDLLAAFGHRLREATDACTVARLAGDEFAVISPPAMPKDRFQALIATVLEQQSAPFHLRGHTFNVSVSIGVARGPSDGEDVGELLAAADAAMYGTKQAGRCGFQFFDPAMGERRRTQAELRRDLPRAMAQGEFVPFYQPVIELASGRLIKFEILARWKHPRRGILSPDLFLPVLASAEQLTQMTTRLLRQAGHDLARWHPSLRLAFNVSPQQLTHGSILPMLDDLRSSGAVPITRLEMEITESALVHNPVEARDIVAAVRRMGLSTALDDFGVGFSSLKHLREIEFDRLKLDRSFVKDVARDAQSRRFVGAMIDLARKLGLSVIGEGIEDGETAAALAKLGCHYGQGYFYGKPKPADVLNKHLPDRAPRGSRRRQAG